MMDKYIDLLIKESLKKLAEPKKGKKNKKPEESKEAAATGGGYAFSSPAFSMWSEDDVAKSEYKKSEPIEGEFTEATGSGSVGAYDANSFENIGMKGNTLKGQGRSWKKSQIPGGSFVEINKKCKTFPYCNQGNTGAVTYKKPSKSKKSPMNEAIENVSIKTGLSVEEIKNIILKSIDRNL
jgi:hypothetical protein